MRAVCSIVLSGLRALALAVMKNVVTVDLNPAVAVAEHVGAGVVLIPYCGFHDEDIAAL